MDAQSHNPQVMPEHYDFTSYMKKPRWISTWHQIDEILQQQPRSVLEIGVGPGIVGMIVGGTGIRYETVDIDPELNPDHVGSVTRLPFPDGSFDLVACYQVLEHLPYESFVPALREMARVSNGHLVVSLPDVTPVWRCTIHVPRLGDISFLLRRPSLRAVKLSCPAQHEWEIGITGYPLRRVLNDIALAQLAAERTYRVFETPYHRFFCLSK